MITFFGWWAFFSAVTAIFWGFAHRSLRADHGNEDAWLED